MSKPTTTSRDFAKTPKPFDVSVLEALCSELHTYGLPAEVHNVTICSCHADDRRSGITRARSYLVAGVTQRDDRAALSVIIRIKDGAASIEHDEFEHLIKLDDPASTDKIVRYTIGKLITGLLHRAFWSR